MGIDIVKDIDDELYINLDGFRDLLQSDIEELENLGDEYGLISGINHCIERLDSLKRRGV
jgi:hypothetical protein